MRTNLLSEASRAWIYTPADAGQDIEVIHWQYYSFLTVTGNQNGNVNVSSILSFFNATAGMPTSTGVLTKQDTNIPKPNAVGSPYKFLIQEVFPLIFPVAALPAQALTAPKQQMDDVLQILKSGVVNLKVLGVDRMEVAPIMVLGSGAGIAGSTHLQAFSNGFPAQSNHYNVEIGLHKDTSFELTVSFPNAFPVYNDIRFGMILDGLLQRPKGK
jgi:hypothetical protein